MNEPITIAKVRKDPKSSELKSSAGKWVLVAGPDAHFSEHNSARVKCVNAGLVSEDYDQIIVGRIRHTSPALILQTEAEKKRFDSDLKKDLESLDSASKDANVRQAALDKKIQDEAAKAHSEKVAEVDEFNKGIASQKLTK